MADQGLTNSAAMAYSLGKPEVMETGMLNRTTKWIRMGVPALICLLLLPGVSRAACTQDDLTGVWFLNGIVGSLLSRSVNEVNTCKVKFSSSGSVLTGSSSCTTRRAFSSYEININGGDVTLNGACELKGALSYCTNGFCSEIVITGARMDSQKSVIAFLGYAAYAPDVIFDWTGVKKE